MGGDSPIANRRPFPYYSSAKHVIPNPSFVRINSVRNLTYKKYQIINALLHLFRNFRNGICFIILSLSISIIKIIIRKGSAGTLYLTIAPMTGVISPVKINMQITPKRQA